MFIGAVELFEDNLDAKLLKKILDKHVIKTALSIWPSSQWYYLHDNDPKHKNSKIIKQWLHNNGITSIDHPSNSPDVNPIENLISIVKRKVDDRHPQTIEQEKAYFIEEWMRDDDEMRQIRRNLALICRVAVKKF